MVIFFYFWNINSIHNGFADFGIPSESNRSNRSDMFFKIRVLKNFVKLTGKHLCQSVFFNSFQTCNSIEKRRPLHGCFPLNFAEFVGTPPVAAIGITLCFNNGRRKSMFVFSWYPGFFWKATFHFGSVLHILYENSTLTLVSKQGSW